MKRFKNKMIGLSFIVVILMSISILFQGCQKWCEETYPDDPPTLADLATSSGDNVGTTTIGFNSCEHYATLWGTAYSTCNVDVYDDNDTQFAGGWILLKTEDVNGLPDVAYTTFDESLNKLEFWETKAIYEASNPDANGIVNYFAHNIRPEVCDPNNPTQCHTFVNAIVQPAETKELDGQAEINVDKIWITW